MPLCTLDAESRMGKNQDPDPGSESGMNNPDHISASLETIFWVKTLKFFDAAPGSEMEKIWIRDGKNLDPRYTSRIRNTTFWNKY